MKPARRSPGGAARSRRRCRRRPTSWWRATTPAANTTRRSRSACRCWTRRGCGYCWRTARRRRGRSLRSTIKSSAGPRPDPRITTMSIARDDVAHLARLARLALAEDELDHLAAQLDVIIAAVARVQEVAADGIPPTSHAVPLVNVFREDTLVPCLDAETVLSQAPAVEQQRSRVPRILAED